MAITVGALVVIGILLTLTFVLLLCVGNPSSIVEMVSKRLGIGSNSDPERELSKGRHVDSGLMKAEKHGNGNEHVQMEEGFNKYTDAPTTTSTKDKDDDTDSESDPKENYDYPTPKQPRAAKREVPTPEELKETAKADEEPSRVGNDINTEKGDERQIDDLPAYENAKIGQPKPAPRKITKPKMPTKEKHDDDSDQLYQNVSAGK